jgi:hypothetical protein
VGRGRKMPTKYERKTKDKLIERIRELVDALDKQRTISYDLAIAEVSLVGRLNQLKAENEALRESFKAMHKHRYDSECEVCNEIVIRLDALLTEEESEP